MYYSTYYNDRSHYRIPKITNEVDYIMSAGTEGISTFLDYRVKNTQIINSPKQIELSNIIRFLNKAKEIINGRNTSEHYNKFFIAKRNGGRREILAPEEWLKDLQTRLVTRLKFDFALLEHNAAHAYTENRSNATNARVHVNNYNFVNIDLTNFFPSITKDLIEQSLLTNANTHNLMLNLPSDLKETFFDIILYNGALPQGSTASPYISNIIMVGFDYHLHKILLEKRRDIVMTRYADDITFSSKLKIDQNLMLEFIEEAKRLAFGEHHSLINVNPEKTRTTTYRGKNRVTGVKINANNELSIGYKEKQQLKIDMVSLIINKLRGNELDPEMTYKVIGMFSYLHGIEPSYAKYLLRQWSNKFEISNIFKFLTSNGPLEMVDLPF